MNSIFDTTKTIVAVSTPIGVGGVSIVRLSGKNAISIADKLFSANKKKPSSFKYRELVFGNFNTESVKDKCLCVVFKGPNSYTGDDVVEFQCHGGIKIAEKIVKECINNGAVIAQNGEFSVRAFLNGKMSLSEAEGMIDMINAQSDSELKAGYSLMKGDLTQKINEYQQQVVDLLSDIEVSFDYPEEDIEYTTKKKVELKVKEIIVNLNELLKTSATGQIIKDGINAVIVGKPNVGKSSLLNALLNKEKAIVTNIEGTTRDVIEDAFEVNGIKVNILDTAGIRETENIIEKLGVEKSLELINSADIVLFVVDASMPLDKKDIQILNLLKGKKYLTIYNKIDCVTSVNKSPNGIYISAKNKTGIENLKQKIHEIVIDKNIIANSIILTNNRHIEAIKMAKKSLENSIEDISNKTLDLTSIDLKEVYESLGQITGTTTNETILDSIFSKFCLGK